MSGIISSTDTPKSIVDQGGAVVSAPAPDPDQVATVGTDTVLSITSWGVCDGVFGLLTPIQFMLSYGLVTIDQIAWTTADIFVVRLGVGQSGLDDGWETITVNGQTFTRSEADNFTDGDTWLFFGVTSNPMGTTVDATRGIFWTTT